MGLGGGNSSLEMLQCPEHATFINMQLKIQIG